MASGVSSWGPNPEQPEGLGASDPSRDAGFSGMFSSTTPATSRLSSLLVFLSRLIELTSLELL